MRPPLYRLVESHFDEVKGQWEERFEGRYGYWRGLVDEQVRRYQDCGLFENGFARIQCPECHAEYLLAFSCKTRDLCPSCAAKRGAATAALLAEDVLEKVGHAQWVFVMPKMLRPYFPHHREPLGGLAMQRCQHHAEPGRAQPLNDRGPGSSAQLTGWPCNGHRTDSPRTVQADR